MQLDLFSQVATEPRLARLGDPQSSKEAAQHVETSGIGGRMCQLAIHLIKRHQGRTAKELEKLRDLDDGQVRKRLTTLERKGFIRRGDPRRCSVSGRQAATWWIA
jgi:predicted ArsR family transcriptional regulator